MRSGSERVKCWENPQSHNDWSVWPEILIITATWTMAVSFFLFFFFSFLPKGLFFPNDYSLRCLSSKGAGNWHHQQRTKEGLKEIDCQSTADKGGRSNRNITEPPLPSDKKINSDWCLTSVLPSLRPRAWGETKRISNLTCKKWWLKVLKDNEDCLLKHVWCLGCHISTQVTNNNNQSLFVSCIYIFV